MKRIIIILLCALTLFAVSCQNPQEDGLKALFYTRCSAEAAFALAKANGLPTCEGLKCVCGKEKMEEFYASVNEKKPASILTAVYYDMPDDEGPDFFFSLIEYDGDKFSVTVRQSDSKDLDTQGTYKYLKHYKGEAPAQALMSDYEYYCLVNDGNVEWEDIERGMVSSWSGAWVDHVTVFSDMTYKE
ncbi:MAG: hypothetical protein IKH51_11275 [Clostridia bacterium]|nr:hypothetical protein [Clostridia bacterium]